MTLKAISNSGLPPEENMKTLNFIIGIALLNLITIPVNSSLVDQKKEEVVNQISYSKALVQTDSFHYYHTVSKPLINELEVQQAKKIQEEKDAQEKQRQIEIAAEIEAQAKILAQKEAEEKARLELVKQEAAVKAAQAQIKPVIKVEEPVVVKTPYTGMDFESAIRLACQKNGCVAEELISTMYCESGGRANALSSNGLYKGLFQFGDRTFYGYASKLKTDSPDIWNPYQQIEITSWMFANGGKGHWSCAKKFN